MTKRKNLTIAPGYCTVPQGAEIMTKKSGYPISNSQICKLCVAKILEATKIGKNWLIKIDSINNYQRPKRGAKPKIVA